MIYYSPVDGDAIVKSIAYSPRSCFVMTKLGDSVPPVISEIRELLSIKLKERDIKEIDASSIITGKDFKASLDKYFDFFFSLEEYFLEMSDHLEKNPLLSIDYLRRAYLISGNREYRNKVNEISGALDLAARAKNSVENLISRF